MNKIYLRKSLYLGCSLVNPLLYRKFPGIFILCYHGISSENWRFNISLDKFTKQIEYLTSHYEPIKLSEVQDYVEGRKLLNRPGFVITFDDGYRSLLSCIQLLKENKISPCLFVLSKPDEANHAELENNFPLLSVGEIKLLAKSGWEIGSHSATHPNFYKLSEDEAENEIIKSKEELENSLGIQVDFFSYPKGNYNLNLVDLVQKAGYKFGVSMDSDFVNVKSNKFALPRVGVDNSHSFNEFKSLFIPASVNLRRWITKKFGVINYE